MSDMDELKQMIIDLSSTVSSIAMRLTEHSARFDRLEKKIDAAEDRLTQRLTVVERKVDDTRNELELTRANLADTIRDHSTRS